MLVFVTVGSTRFDALIASILTKQVLVSLHRKGYTSLVVQCGESSVEQVGTVKNGERKFMSKWGVDVEVWKFKNSLDEEFERADLIVSHAGSGTILEVLRKGKLMIVVPNPTLLDNHQEELALSLEEMGYLKMATVENLSRVVEEFDPSRIKPFPPFDGSRFARIVDEAAGFM